MKNGDIVHFWLLFLVSLFCLTHSNLGLAGTDANDQIIWLIRMQNPNTGLVESYEGNDNNFAYIFDQALAIIAFTEANEPNRARMILEKMKDLQIEDPNGPWNQWYRVDDPNNIDWGSEKYVTGDIAWMVMAVNFYECRTRDPNYANMARRALGWMDTMMHTDDPNDGRYGSLRYCGGPRCGQYNPNEPNIISTEHNIDAYSAYYWRGMLDANDSYLYKASLILDYLRNEMWAPTLGSNCGEDANVFCRGYNDPDVLATDCQSWAVLSLGPFGPDGEQFCESLYWLLDSDLQTTCDFNDSITDVNGFKSESNEQCEYVRVDLTESVAAAFFSIGDDPNGIYFHNEMRRTVDANGGLVHSFSCQDPNTIRWPENYRYNYVASVAWYYFNEVGLNPFNLRPCSAECRAANINETDSVNFIDYAIFALDWLEDGSDLAGDINGDRLVNRADLFLLSEYWLWDCND